MSRLIPLRIINLDSEERPNHLNLTYLARPRN